MSICCFCCPQRTWCYTRWQSVYSCDDLSWSTPTSVSRSCLASPLYSTWTNVSGCNFQIDVKGKCCVSDDNCTVDSAAPSAPTDSMNCCSGCDNTEGTSLNVTGTKPLVGSIPTDLGDPCFNFNGGDTGNDCDGDSGLTVTQQFSSPPDPVALCVYTFFDQTSSTCFYGAQIRFITVEWVGAAGATPGYWKLTIGGRWLGGGMEWIGVLHSHSPIGVYTKTNPCYDPATYTVS